MAPSNANTPPTRTVIAANSLPESTIFTTTPTQNYATGATSTTGGDGSHTHPFSGSGGSATFTGNAINLAVQYVDVIRATKN